jgi:hydrogenase-4 component B
MTPALSLLCAGGALTAGLIAGPRFARLWVALMLLGNLALLSAALLVLAGTGDWQWWSAFALGGEVLHLRLDGLSAMFLVLLGVVGGSGAVYAREYWPDGERASAPRGRLWWSAMILSMATVLLSSNGLHFLIAWELFAVSSFFLITLERERREVRAAGWLYLAASHVGTLCLFGFFATLAARTGGWELGPWRDQPALGALFWLAFAGFAVKAGLWPVHVWLPSAHASAPSHVSALMSGVAIKMGIYGLVRFSGWLPVPAAVGWVLMGVGAVTALFGIVCALVQNDLKRLLAYCSVENVGIMAVGIGGALLSAGQTNAPWGRLLLAGALLHVWNHGLCKALLFLCAGSVLHATGSRELSRLGGLWRTMPWTAGLFALGAASISALPPLNGLVSEWLVYLGLFEGATGRTAASWPAMLAVLSLALAGALALATFVKAGAMVFLGAPRTKLPAAAHEAGPLMQGPMRLLALLCVALGLAPMLVWPALNRVVREWNPGWGATDPTAPLVHLGQVHIGVALAFVAAALWWWRRAASARRAPTWDCGYATPTARMQYTSGSFAAIPASWFDWALSPARIQRRPRGPFPAGASRMEPVQEPVLDRLLAPLADEVMRWAAAARQLQHGRVQFYILYLAGGLSVVALITWLGGQP